MGKETYSLCVTVKATSEMINLFLQHHLKTEVSEIFVFLDSPSDFSIEELILDNRIQYFQCDDEFWKNREYFPILSHKKGIRPNGVEQRQYHNMLHAYSITTSNWLMMIDIDEFLISTRNIETILAEYPENVFSVRAASLEAVYENIAPQNFQEAFSTPYFKSRTKFSYPYWDNIYTEKALNHKSGFFGHVTGKTFCRTGLELLRVSCHLTRPIDKDLVVAINSNELKILHFEALTANFFVEKNLKRVNGDFYVPYLDRPSQERLIYIKEVFDKKGKVGLYDIYNQMHVFPFDIMNKAIIDGFVEYYSQYQIDNFKEIIVTHHNSVLVFDTVMNIVRAVNLKEIDNVKLIPIKCALTLKGSDLQQKAYFYYVNKFGKVIFLYLNKENKITESNFHKAQLLNLERKNGGAWFSLQLEQKYFTAHKNGNFELKANHIDSWELFKIITLK